MKTQKAPLPETESAAEALGAQIAVARREMGWTQGDLAERLGTTRHLVSRIEGGSTGVALGTVLEAAIICGVPLFGVERHSLSLVVERDRARAASTPARVRSRTPVIDNDF